MTGYTTVWVRPGASDFHYAGPYGTGDGSSYANAISGLMNVPWTMTKLQVIVAGTHLKIWTGVGTVTNHALIPVMAGTSDYPTIVRGDATRFDATATPGLICAGMIDQNSPAWEDLGGGVWRRSSGLYSFTYRTWSARVVGGETQPSQFPVVTPVETQAACIATENTSFLEFTGNPHTIYIHLPVGVNPTTHYITPDYGYRFNITDRQNIILNRLQIMFSMILNPVRLECRKSDFWYWPNELFSITGNRPGNIVDRCQISFAKAGVYAFSVQATPPQVSNNIRVTGTYITDIGGEWFTREDTGACAIASRQGMDDCYIDGCKTIRTGHPIVMYSYHWSRKCRNVVVKRTVCRAPHSWYVWPDWNGIALNPLDSWNTIEWEGFDASGNVVERCYVDGAGMNTPIRNGIVVDYDVNDLARTFRCINNQVDNGQFGIALVNESASYPTVRGSTSYLRGNVMRWQTNAHFLKSGDDTPRKNHARGGGVNSDLNIIIDGPVTPTSDYRFGASTLTLAQWKAESVRFDPNSVKL